MKFNECVQLNLVYVLYLHDRSALNGSQYLEYIEYKIDKWFS